MTSHRFVRLAHGSPSLALLLIVFSWIVPNHSALASSRGAVLLSASASSRALAVSGSAPIVESIPPVNLRRGASLDLQVFAHDPDGDPLTFARSFGPDFMTVTTVRSGPPMAEGLIHLQPSPQDTLVTTSGGVVVSDGFLVGQRSFPIHVGGYPPIIDDPNDMVVSENSTEDQLLHASDVDGDSLSFTLAPAPGFVSFVNLGGGYAQLHLAPGFSDAGQYTLTITASDGTASDTRTVFVVVNDRDRPPILAQPSPMFVRAGETADQTLTATDPDGEPLWFDRVGGPWYVLVSTTNSGSGAATGNVHLAPRPGDAPVADSVTVTQDLTVGVFDPAFVSDRKTFPITVSFPVDHPPVLDPPVDMTVAENATADQVAHATDPDGDPVAVWVATGPPFVEMGPSGIRVAPGFTDSGDYTILLHAEDSRGLSDEKSFQVHVTQTNAAPAVQFLNAMIAFPGRTATQEIHATDLDGDSIQFAAIEPPFMSVTTLFSGPGTATGLIRVSPSLSDVGTVVGTVDISDGVLHSSRSFPIEVHPSGYPVILSTPDACFHSGFTSISLHAIDPEGDALSFSASGLPQYGALSDHGDGSADIELRATSSDPYGVAFVTARVSDGVLLDSEMFVINYAPSGACPGEGLHWNPPLLGIGGNKPPLARITGPVQGVVGTATVLDGSLSHDLDNQPLSFGWSFGDGSFGLGPTPTHRYAAAGVYEVTLFVSDGAATSRRITTATIADAYPGKAMLPPGQARIKLWTGEPRLCVLLEPAGNGYSNSDVDHSSLQLWSEGTGQVDHIAAIPFKTTTLEDRDGDGIPEIDACFKKEDLRRLFSSVTESRSVTARVEGNIVTGGRFRALLPLTIEPRPRHAAEVFPNPLNPSSTLSFVTTRPGPVRIALYVATGRLVCILHDEKAAPAGDHEIRIGAAGLSSGLYFYRIESADGVTSGRLVILK